MKNLFFLIVLIVAGCQQSYYRITDIESGQSFYTKAWLPGLYGRCGQITFTDLRSGDRVVLHSSRASTVSEDQVPAPSANLPRAAIVNPS